MEGYTKKVQEWPVLQNGIHYTWLVDYTAYNAFGNFELTDKEWEKRNLITNFKGNSELTTETDHQQALKEAIEMVTALIKATFAEDATQLTLVCIPASKKSHTERRFKNFSEAVCAATGLENAYEHFSYTISKDEDEADFCKIDEPYFAGKKVLLFDDIISSGGSVCRFADKLSALDATVVATIGLGKTLR